MIKKIEALGWSIYVDGGYTSFGKYSPFGEDFSFSVDSGSDKEVRAQVLDYLEGYDADEHAREVLRMKSFYGTVRDAADDADAIRGNLVELKDAFFEE